MYAGGSLMHFTPIVVILVLLVLIVGVVWRLLSRRQSLPCPVWLRWLVELDNPFTKTNRAAFIVETLGLAPGMSVLDAGCGPGRLTLPIARRVGEDGRVIALDMQSGMLARVSEKAESAGLLNIELRCDKLGEVRLPDNAFDRAVLVAVLGEIPDQASAIKAIYDTLRPGGVLAVVEVIFDPHFQPRNRVRTLASSAGFDEAAFYGHRLAYVIHFRKPGG